ncbi:MAG: mannitol dehydrogenase family protein [Acidimicrobiales bacterium]|nr:mannitol dehydrogenase family protein [Acidimicrobiales bacterium]
MSPAARLSNGTLPTLAGAVGPAYDRSTVEAGVVHVGLGAFARAHVARYCDDLLASGVEQAAVVGASLRSGATTRSLTPQDGLYTLIETDGRSSDLRVIGAVTALAEGPGATIAALSAPATTAVTLTVTEKGYHRAPAAGRPRLDLDDPDIAHDVAQPDDPRTLPGVLTAGLRRRRDCGAGGLTLISCDNLPANGEVTAAVVTELAAAVDPTLAEWIRANVAFPSTVVDRIVPATTDRERQLVTARTGLVDAAPVLAETHCSWVIEDVPASLTPLLVGWQRVGALLVDDVAPWQERKLRLVNGPHSALAYLGALAGHETIDAAATDPDLGPFVAALMTREIVPTVSGGAAGSDDEDPTNVADATLARFANPALGHHTRQVAADGTQKLRQRVLDPISVRLAAGDGIDRLALVVAAWMAWVAHCVKSGEHLEDPLAGQLSDAVRGTGSTSGQLARALFGTEAVFDPATAANEQLHRAVVRALDLLHDRGPAAAARALT